MSNPIEPNHYKLPNGLQVFDLIEDWGLGFHGGNVLKYVLRAGVKDPAKYNEDLDKALKYVNRMQEKGIKARTSGIKRTISTLILDKKYDAFMSYLFISAYDPLITEIQKLKK